MSPKLCRQKLSLFCSRNHFTMFWWLEVQSGRVNSDFSCCLDWGVKNTFLCKHVLMNRLCRGRALRCVLLPCQQREGRCTFWSYIKMAVVLNSNTTQKTQKLFAFETLYNEATGRKLLSVKNKSSPLAAQKKNTLENWSNFIPENSNPPTVLFYRCFFFHISVLLFCWFDLRTFAPLLDKINSILFVLLARKQKEGKKTTLTSQQPSINQFHFPFINKNLQFVHET